MSDPEINPPRIALLGVPLEIGASQRGTLMGPDALRTAGIGRVLGQLGFAVEDHGNLSIKTVSPAEGPAPAHAKYYDEIKIWIRGLSERAFELARSGAIPVFMGGDHSLSMGSVNGVARHWKQQHSRSAVPPVLGLGDHFYRVLVEGVSGAGSHLRRCQ